MKYFFALWVFISFSIPAFFANSQSLPSYVPTNGLIGWWGFNGNAQDASGNGNHGMVNGAISTIDRFGNLNSAYSFDGLDDYIQTSAIGPSGNSSRSFTFWIKTANTAIQTPIDYYGQFGTAFQAILNSPCPGLGIDGAFGVVTRGGPFLINNEWHHCALVFDSQIGNTISDVKIYIDGNLQPTIICSAVNPNLIINTSDPGAFVFGKTTSNLRFVDGKLDDIGIWNRALNQQEITNLYISQLPNQTSLCLPTISTNTPTSIGIDSVIVGGNITNDGGSSIVLRGVCYSTTPNPNMGNMRTEDGSGVGSFSTILRNLSPSTTYYLKSYAKNANGVVVYGDEVSFSTGTLIPGIRCPGTPSVTDIDGNLYHTVQIGNQCWTQSNLRTSRYRNGDTIPYIISNSQWAQSNGIGFACHYDNNTNQASIGLGRLYNGYAALDSRSLCPTGWHLPSDAEWTTLEDAVGGSSVAGTSLKSTETSPVLGGWGLGLNISITNSSGFTALSGGFREPWGDFADLGRGGGWWSASTYDSLNLWSRRPDCCSNVWIHALGNKSVGFSVRCLKDVVPSVSTSAVSNVTASSATTGGDVTQDGGAPVTARGVAYGTSSSPTTSGSITYDGTGTGLFTSTLTGLTPSTTYYVRAYATNSVGTAYGNEIIFSTNTSNGFSSCGGVSDADGNIYQTVQIGTQCWTQSNLKVSKYRNGDNIPTGLSNTAWENTTAGAYAISNYNSLNDSLYGKLYNNYAVTDTRGLCPTGWHVPTDGEWNILVKYLDPNADTLCYHCWQSSVAGGMLKSTITQPTPGGWATPNIGATNSSGFTAGPGGRMHPDGSFDPVGGNGSWWSSSFSGLYAWNRNLHEFDAGIYKPNGLRTVGFSVRCLRD